jgi:hypothetical protein
MLVTENEAQKKWCCMGVEADLRCCGSNCMVWEWEDGKPSNDDSAAKSIW